VHGRCQREQRGQRQQRHGFHARECRERPRCVDRRDGYLLLESAHAGLPRVEVDHAERARCRVVCDQHHGELLRARVDIACLAQHRQLVSHCGPARLHRKDHWVSQRAAGHGAPEEAVGGSEAVDLWGAPAGVIEVAFRGDSVLVEHRTQGIEGRVQPICLPMRARCGVHHCAAAMQDQLGERLSAAGLIAVALQVQHQPANHLQTYASASPSSCANLAAGA
jgi:hypothetical protein